VIGINPLLIYGFVLLGGAGLISRLVIPASTVVFGWFNQILLLFISGLVSWALLWVICYIFNLSRIFLKF
jgi:hypothetical protein